MNNRKKVFEEINLTPLLDALFSILFIVMLSGTQSERINQNNSKVLEDNIQILQSDIQTLKDENQHLNNELSKMRSINQGMKHFYEDTLILTLQYVNNTQYLTFSTGEDGVLFTEIAMNGTGDSKTDEDDKEYLINFIKNKINNKILEENKTGPIHIIFSFDNEIIKYHYDIITKALNELNNPRIYLRNYNTEESK